MAITDWFECTISIDGTIAEKYDEDPENTSDDFDSNIVRKYIEARSGANFCVDFRAKPGYRFDCDYLLFEIKLDGEWKAGPVIKKSSYSPTRGAKGTREGSEYGKGSEWSLRKFKFGDLEISGSSSYAICLAGRSHTL